MASRLLFNPGHSNPGATSHQNSGERSWTCGLKASGLGITATADCTFTRPRSRMTVFHTSRDSDYSSPETKSPGLKSQGVTRALKDTTTRPSVHFVVEVLPTRRKGYIP